jgi:hypothetical protein
MPVTTVVNPLAGDESRALSRKIGRWTSLGSLGFGLLYLVGVGVNLSTSGSVYLSGRDVRTVSAAVALLWNLALIVLFVTLRREAEPSRTVLAELALAFAVPRSSGPRTPTWIPSCPGRSWTNSCSMGSPSANRSARP